MVKEFIQMQVGDNTEIFVNGLPNYDKLSKAEKRSLLLPLATVIREFYQDPENRQKFEAWKVEYLKQNPAT